MMRLVARIAATESTVLIQGETGTGKELVARAIHRMSRRATGPMVRLNCGTLSSQLADSELFGHERGAFTGAVQRRAGRFEQAYGGTLFLDEVGELPLETQAKLLRVLQEREFERVGGNDTVQADVRLIAATNRDLKSLIAEGRFRADLFFRLNVVPVLVPSLRSRTSDIPSLVQQFLRRLEVRLGRELGRLGETSLRRLMAYHWPGNIRELHNVMERAAIMSDTAEIDVPEDLLAFDGMNPAPEDNVSSHRPSVAAVPRTPQLTALEDVEREHILAILEQTRWRLSGSAGAAAILGLHPNTLRHRMKKLSIGR
jgi:transcriptional regulator with GAF, ATPase, and Fis domain